MKLYRTVSTNEFEDYTQFKQFRVARNTLEGKQFFKTEAGVKEFILDAKKQSYYPPYSHLLIVEVDSECLSNIQFDEQELDRFDAITIQEINLSAFNNCIKFVQLYDI